METNEIAKKMLIPALILPVMAGGLLLYRTCCHAEDTKQKVVQMQQDVDAFNQKAILINNSPFRPVQVDQVNDVQQNIIKTAGQYALEIVSMKPVKTDESGQTYEMHFSGAWANSALYLENFKVKDALISMRSISLNVDKGVVHTIFQYKIYTK